MAFSILHGFAVLEGLDGAGRSTQLALAHERLDREGRPHYATSEPTDGPVGRLIRTLLRRQAVALPRTVALLYAADRHEHVFGPGGIVERTRRGELVLCDRFLFSSLAYQSVECGFDEVLALNSGFPLPELLVFLDTPVAVCQRRLAARPGSELYDGASFQARVREGYLRAISHFDGSGMRVAVLDGDRPPDAIHEELWILLRGLPIQEV